MKLDKATVILGENDICKDCIKTDVCKHKANLDKDPIIGMSVEKCEHFKDKSKFIELPCKVGDTVWYVNNDEEDCTGYIFLGCNEKYAFIKGGINGSFDVDDICNYAYEQFLEWEEKIYCVPLNKLFFSKEEAEKALAERSEENGNYN